MFRKLIRQPRTQAAMARSLGAYLAFCYRTTRWSLVGQEHLAVFARRNEPMIIAFWHERLPMMPMLWTVTHRLHPETKDWQPHVLVSQHRDGRFIGEIVSRFRLAMLYGSTSRGGATALRSMLRVLREGSPVVITPDGPRGPRRKAAEGVAQLAALSSVVIVPTAAATLRHRLLPSWDRMMLPLPFTRGVLVCGPPIRVSRGDTALAVAAIETALDAACDAADGWVADPASQNSRPL
ncbi:lysophospholipid acyltransferase family protein [Teichococcus vastitatis]|uniref:Lysophospholipid acyltransferase family protein n=1 Tax=Teichococcus vastitatis TaxID=2307076 RepID=A0ABS9W699_9PROT|nr:lysophospholipid acyltransferase family protein [Pseudoroseomonas vastitatis]MCI0754335.1 lysophospholipid acyltransferase family protein [Pseudoroseomonas vastitatis]